MKSTSILILVLPLLSDLGAIGQAQLTPPMPIAACVQKLAGSYEIRTDLNPFYLRGDFLGTGEPAFAVAIRRNNPLQVGVLLCPASGAPLLFMPGEIGRFVSKDFKESHFVAPDWEVYTKAQANELLKRNRRSGLAVGEAIAMIWEDGIGLLYSNGNRFQWEPSMQ